EDSHLACFREVHRYLAQGEKDGGRNRAVVGVYLGWRGLSLKIPLIQWATFWTRKAAAERIGEAQALETLTALEDLDRELQKNGRPDSRLILLGHSFGSTLFQRARNSIQSGLMTRTAANYEPFVTHTLKPAGGPLPRPPRGQEGPCRCETPLRQHLQKRMEADRGRHASAQMMAEQKTVAHFDLAANQRSS